MMSPMYHVEFQTLLLCCMLRSPAFWEKVSANVRPEDFGPACLRFIFELARNHFVRYGALPAPETLLLLVDAAVKSPVPELQTVMPPSEAELLVYVLQKYLQYQVTPAEVAFYESHLHPYLAEARWAALKDDNLDAADMVTRAVQLREDLQRVHTSPFRMVRGTAPIPKEARSSGARYGFGVSAIDNRLSAGLMRKQMGLVVACTGVGKTTSMTGAMAYMTWRKVGSLYITLEMNAERIQERYQGMLAGIPASCFKEDESKWPAAYRKRYAAVTGPGFKLADYGTICDMSSKDFTVDEIEQAINVWKGSVSKAGHDPDTFCTNIYIDWLDRLSGEGIKKINKNSTEERVWAHILERLYQMLNRHNLVGWVATQGKPDAKGKEVLTLKDVAWGGAKAHLMDAVLGLAPAAVDVDVKDAATSVMQSNEDQGRAPECNRTLNVSFMKTRDTSAVDTHTPVYQDPTLRLWNDQTDSLRFRERILSDPLYGLKDVLDG